VAKALKPGDPEPRVEALGQLGGRAASAQPAVPQLLPLLDDATSGSAAGRPTRWSGSARRRPPTWARS
jgi:hypothetical protein